MSATTTQATKRAAGGLLLVAEARDAATSGRGAQLRNAHGLSQGEVATAVGVTPSAICRWENGDRRPRGDAAVRYALLLRGLTDR